MPYSSGGRPATALSPMLGIALPSNTQTSLPSSMRTTSGARSPHLAGEVAVEQVGRLDDVVVDAHEDQVFGVHRQPPMKLTWLLEYIVVTRSSPQGTTAAHDDVRRESWLLRAP